MARFGATARRVSAAWGNTWYIVRREMDGGQSRVIQWWDSVLKLKVPLTIKIIPSLS